MLILLVDMLFLHVEVTSDGVVEVLELLNLLPQSKDFALREIQVPLQVNHLIINV